MTEQRQTEFVELFLRNQDKIYRYIASYLPKRSEADDVFQQTSLILWKKRDLYDWNQDFLRWSFGIARNELRSYFRASSKNGHVRLSDELMSILSEERISHADELELRKQALAYCMDKLTTDHRTLLDGYYESKSTIRDFAESIGSTPAAIYKRLSRIRTSLMTCIKRRIAMEMNT